MVIGMISLKTFFRQKMAIFFMVLFATVLLIANLAVFALSSVQYQRQIDREQEAFKTMMVHFLTMEDTETAITYIEHYNHVNGIDIAFYNDEGALLYTTADGVSEDNVLILEDGDGTLLGTVFYDDQQSYFAGDLTWGLLIMNGFSIIIFLVFLKILYGYLNGWHRFLREDFSRLGKDSDEFHFTDLRDTSIRLKESIEKEKRLREYHKEYVKMLAHDIKTPLTVIKANIEGIKLNRIEAHDDVWDEMLEEIDALEAMVPKFMTNSIESTPKRQNISPIIKSIIARLNEVFETKHITVKTELDDFEMKVSYMDISRIVEHVLMNAFYYNHDYGSIEVTLNAKEKILSVHDTGIGMDQDTIKKVKKKSYRSSAAKTMNQQGSGMGLQIVFEIIKRLGMTIDFDSKPKKGTTVMIDLDADY